MGKPCIYLTKHISNGMWYIGSHKDSDNILSKSYIGSGTSISEAIESEGIESFTSEVLREFNTRDDAFKGEHQLLNLVDAAGDANSYNNTNNSWPKEGFIKRIMGNKRGPLDLMELNDMKEKIFSSSSSSSQENKGTLTFEDVTAQMERQCYTIGLELGAKYGIEHQVEDNIIIQRNTMIDRVKRNIHLRETDMEKAKVILEHNSDDLQAKLDLKESESTVKYFNSMLDDYTNKTGWYSSFDSQYREGIKEGMRQYLENKIRLRHGSK